MKTHDMSKINTDATGDVTGVNLYCKGNELVTTPLIERCTSVIYPTNALNSIKRKGLREPSALEVASFLEVAYGLSDRRNMPSKSFMSSGFIPAFTGILYDSEKDRIVFVDPPIERNDIGELCVEGLLKMIKDGDSRAIKYSKVTEGIKTPSELARDIYIIGLAGKEGAQKLAEVANRHSKKRAFVNLWPMIKDGSGILQSEIALFGSCSGNVFGENNYIGSDMLFIKGYCGKYGELCREISPFGIFQNTK